MVNQAQCPNCGSAINDGQNFCLNCGAAITPPAAQHPMKWYKFLIYFSLFAGAVLNFIAAMLYITGAVYPATSGGQATAQLVYETFGSSLKTVDVLYGIVLLCLAAFGIVTRFKLSSFKKEAPVCLYVVYIADVVFMLIYSIAVTATTDVLSISASDISSITATVIMVILNYIYFKKRQDLFVN